MTSKELKRAKARQVRYAKKLRKAAIYLYGTPIGKKPLIAAVGILKVLSLGTKRGWLYPQEIATLTKLTSSTGKPVRKHATA
jgi:hypothetical protein